MTYFTILCNKSTQRMHISKSLLFAFWSEIAVVAESPCSVAASKATSAAGMAECYVGFLVLSYFSIWSFMFVYIYLSNVFVCYLTTLSR